MKTNFRIIFLLLVGILSTLPAMAEEYIKTITVLEQGQVVPVEELYLNPSNENKPSRVRVKNGVEFFIQLPEGHSIENLSGGTLEEGNKIRVSKAGTLRFYFQYQGVEKFVRVHTNYFGVIQYRGSDAPETIEVNQGNESKTLSVPAGKFPSIGWLASPLEENNFQLLHTNFTQNSMSLSEILQKAKEKFPNIKEFFLKGDFYDGTSNGQDYSESEHIVQIKDKRVPVPTYTISLSAQPAEGGQVSGGGTFNENTEVTVSASPASGWTFVKWTEGGSVVSTSDSYTFTITGNRNLVAVFEQISVPTYTVNLSAQPAEGGSVSGAGTYDENSQVTVSASPKEGWTFVKWTENGSEVSTSANYSFQITKNRSLVAHFERIPVTPPTSFNILRTYQRDAIISWEPRGNESEWEVSYGDRKVIVTEPRAILRGLTPNTDYEITVRAKVGEQLSEPLKGSLKTEDFTAKHHLIPHLYGMKEIFSEGDILPIFWEDLEKLPKKISYNLSPLTSTSEEKKNKIFSPLPEAISFSEKGTFILTFKFEGHDTFEEIEYLLEVKWKKRKTWFSPSCWRAHLERLENHKKW